MIVGVIVLLISLMMGIPIAFSLGISSAAILYTKNFPLLVIAQRMFTGIDVFPFMAVPFFILAGSLMEKSGITKNLVKFSDLFVGHIKGGLSHINVVSNMFLAGISGSAVADASAIGSMMIPAMKEKGFDLDFSAAITAASSVVGPIIPPSIPMVIFALLSGQSVAALFMAGMFSRSNYPERSMEGSIRAGSEVAECIRTRSTMAEAITTRWRCPPESSWG